MPEPHLLRATVRHTVAVLALAVGISPGTAVAATYYVSPSGSASNSGASPAAPWSLSRANSSLVAGDVAILLPGSYGTAINPANSGTSSARISYVGSIADPAQTVVSSIDLTKAYVTVKGVRATGGMNFDYPARYDSVAWSISGGLRFHGAKFCMAARNTINGSVSIMLNNGQSLSGTANAEYDTLRGNVINLGNVVSSHNFKIRGYSQNCVIDSNRVTATYTSGSGDGIARIFYNSSFITLRDNSWTFEATAPFGSEPWNGFVMRDSSRNYVFERDTVLLGVNSSHPIRGMMAGSGTFPNSVANNLYTGCVYKTNSYIYVQDRLNATTIQNSVFASSTGNALWMLGEFNGCKLKNNLFWSPRQAVKFEGGFQGSGNEITSNIFYGENVQAPGSSGGHVMYGSNSQSNFTSNNNVYFSPAFSSSPGDRSIVWCCYFGSKPGSGQPWNNTFGRDGNSRYGSPRLVDSTFAGLDGHLLAGSAAIGAGVGGIDAGPYAFGSGGTDETPPATVGNLATSQVGDRSLLLTWTAPGDDGFSGTASGYDVRWSTQPISDSNFASATPFAPQPAPIPGGSAQSYVVTGLTPGATYYFALKARDDANNWSGLSNVAGVTTASSDTIPPNTVIDLSGP